jgi:hypothetical protein
MWLSSADNATDDIEHRVVDSAPLSFGALTFLNVAIAVGGESERPDMVGIFRFNLARHREPFLISAPPYGAEPT